MRKKKKGGATTWADPDDAPELTNEYFEQADLYHGQKLIRRGRPKSKHAKQAVKLRLDPDVIAGFKREGPGWQTRVNASLRKALKLPKVSAKI
jgi:uncharacterized protein (DUF4415 family)